MVGFSRLLGALGTAPSVFSVSMATENTLGSPGQRRSAGLKGTSTLTFRHVGVDHGGLHALVAQQLLVVRMSWPFCGDSPATRRGCRQTALGADGFQPAIDFHMPARCRRSQPLMP
jgi:hypothetical protein